MPNKSYIVDASAFDTPANIKPGVYDGSIFDPEPLVKVEPTMTMGQKIGKAVEYLPTAGALAGGALSMAAAPGTAGASLLGGSALAGLGAAAGKAGEQIVKRMVGEEAPKTATEAAKEIGKEGAWTAALNAAGGKVMEALAPTGKLLAKQVMRGFARIDERAAMKVLNDPQILNRAKPIAEAKKDFAKFFEDIGYDYGEKSVKAATGKLNLSDNAADDFIGETLVKIDELSKMPKGAAEQEAKFVVQDALAARYSLKDAINRAVRAGNDSKKRLFVEGKNQIDDWLETQIPGFSSVRKEYEEAKIKQAFSPIFPLNKNKETSVLGILTSIGSTLGAGAINPVAAIPPAIASSPKIMGGAIQVAEKLGNKATGAAVAEILGDKLSKISGEVLSAGVKKEKEDHPQLTDEQAVIIAAQEMAKDPLTYLHEDDIKAKYKAGEIDRKTAIRALHKHHGDKFAH